MEKLQALYEEAESNLRDQIQYYIRHFDYLLSKQNQRPIQRYRKFLEQIIEQMDDYDPFAQPVSFQEFDEDEWEEDLEEDNSKEDFNGGTGGWTS